MSRTSKSDKAAADSPELSKFLTFALGTESYGLHVRNVREIVGMQDITAVPDMPSYINGVINLRGHVIPVMDVRARFGLPRRKYDDRTCIIVVAVSDWSVGLVVDTVSEVLDIPSHNIDPAPKVIGGRRSHFIEGLGKVGDQVRLLLDAQQLLTAEIAEA